MTKVTKPTSAFDFWDERSRTSSHDRSESSEKLKFLLSFKSAAEMTFIHMTHDYKY